MKKRQISWEIIVCGLLLTGIAIYLTGTGKSDRLTPSDKAKIHGEAFTKVIPSDIMTNMPDFSEIANASRKEMETALKKLEESLGKIERSKVNWIAEDDSQFQEIPFTNTEETWVKSSTGEYIYQLTFEAAKTNALLLNMEGGHINLKQIDSDSAVVQFVVASYRYNVDDLKRQFTINKSSEGSKTVIELKQNKSIWKNSGNLKAELRIPKGLNIEANTNGGHLRLSSLTGQHTFSTKGGHITFSDISGTFRARTDGGHIEGKDLSGDFYLTTNGGHITLENLKGSAEAETNGGNINLSNLNASVRAQTSGGNINADIVGLPGDIQLKTSAGNITLQLPVSLQAELDLRGTRVTASQKIVEKLEGNIKDSAIEAVLNNHGGANISAQTSFGTVKVEGKD